MVDHLIDWQKVPDDPLFILTFPRRHMLSPEHDAQMSALVKGGADAQTVKAAAQRIRMHLNPHPAGQVSHNIPSLEGEPLDGMQHKYRETELFSPARARPAMPIAASVFAGPSSWDCPN